MEKRLPGCDPPIRINTVVPFLQHLNCSGHLTSAKTSNRTYSIIRSLRGSTAVLTRPPKRRRLPHKKMLVILLIVLVAEAVPEGTFHKVESSPPFCTLSTTNTPSRSICAIRCVSQGAECGGFNQLRNGTCATFTIGCKGSTVESASLGQIFFREHANPLKKA